MCLVDQNNWRFQFSNTTRLMKLEGKTKPDTILSFETAAYLAHHLADDQSDFGRIQEAINKRIKDDPVAKEWKKKRSLLKHLNHFPKYRKNDFDLYHSAARSCAEGAASPEQTNIFCGLETEINSSKNIVPTGQILFHGRANRDVTNMTPYPTFVSTSFNPVVAFNSALRRSGIDNANGYPTIYVLTLGVSLPVLWGQTGGSYEYELLLPPNLTCNKTEEYRGKKFDVIEADMIGRG